MDSAFYLIVYIVIEAYSRRRFFSVYAIFSAQNNKSDKVIVKKKKNMIRVYTNIIYAGKFLSRFYLSTQLFILF